MKRRKFLQSIGFSGAVTAAAVVPLAIAKAVVEESGFVYAIESAVDSVDNQGNTSTFWVKMSEFDTCQEADAVIEALGGSIINDQTLPVPGIPPGPLSFRYRVVKLKRVRSN